MTLRDASVPPLRQDDESYLEREYHPTLRAALSAAGGSWFASDYYARPSAILAEARRLGVTALRLDLRDLSLLRELPGIRYLDVSSDGRPVLDPIASLPHLRALHLYVSAVRGSLDPCAFPELRWLTMPLGGKGGAGLLESLQRGHSRLEHLGVRETKVRSLTELASRLPRLQSLSVSYADHIRSPGDLTAVADTLRELRLWMVPGLRSLDGVETLEALESVTLWASRVTDLRPLAALPHLREVDIAIADGRRVTTVRELARLA